MPSALFARAFLLHEELPRRRLLQLRAVRSWPLALATNDFGAKWGTSKHERKRECPAPPGLGLDGLAAKLQRANARPVEAIPATNELILAAAHAPSGAPCLFHVKLLPTRAALVTVRSTDPAAAQAALDAATAAVP